MDFQFRVIRGTTAHRIITGDVAACQQVVAEAYLAHHRAESVNPNSYFLRFPEKPTARIIALPAFLGGRFQVAGIKWIASYPENTQRGFPRASAVLLLNNYETGYPYACLESSIISAARTAASAALAAEQMSHQGRTARRIGFVGTGLIARYCYNFLMDLGWSSEQMVLFDHDPAAARRFASEVCRSASHREISVAPDHQSLVRDCDLIVLTTTAATPYITDADLLRHNPLILNVSLRDISPEIILRSHNIVDDIGHVLNANTSVHLAEQRVQHRNFIAGTLADLLTGTPRPDASRPRIFSPFGLGVLDLAVGHWVYHTAVTAGDCVDVDNFFALDA
ncbi:MAG TPA: 2,3-diaminopropionate biosynthesis protein SbnB [Kofleriaceae bacterium]|nr:2,3-diaminopropionate biosynthesis protein SbnB [Kofleriaceae bacterium]